MCRPWMKFLTAGCAALLLMTIPETMLADELEAGLSVPVVSDSESASIEVQSTQVEEEADYVGEGSIVVGDGVAASFDDMTGTVEFYSDGGTLWQDWIDKSGIDIERIKSIRVASGTVYLPSDSSNIFSVIYLNEWFFESNLKEVDLTGFETSNVVSMAGMFEYCNSLTKLDLSSFNTSNVTSMERMFNGCSSLTKLDLSSFDTSEVTSMGGMFYDCSSMTELNLNSFDMSNIGDFNALLFDGLSFVWDRDSESMSSISINVQYKEAFLDGCSNLRLFRTPKKNSVTFRLPVVMYDEAGNEYSELGTLSESILLTDENPVPADENPTPTPTPAVKGFSDVQDPNHAYYKAIYWAADAGITKGYPDGTFGINRSCTRGEMMMFLWRYAGKQEPKEASKSPFKDVPKTHAFYKAILWGSQKGITKGYSDGTFGIDRNVSRGECMMFLWRIKGKPAPKAVTKSPFRDVAATNVFYKAILWGYQNKVTTGYTSGDKKGTFGIDENCKRGQIVTFLYRAK